MNLILRECVHFYKQHDFDADFDAEEVGHW